MVIGGPLLRAAECVSELKRGGISVRTRIAVVAGLMLAAAANPAQAISLPPTCDLNDSLLLQYLMYVQQYPGDSYYLDLYQHRLAEVVASCPGTAVSAQDLQVTQMPATVTTLSNAARRGLGRLRGTETAGLMNLFGRGRSAGDNDAWGIWASFNKGKVKSDFTTSTYDSDTDGLTAGVDYRLSDVMVVGAALGYSSADVTTTFNGGTQQIDGYTIAPYLGYLITPNFSADLSAGYTRSNIDQSRLDSTAASSTDLARSSPDSNRWFLAGNLNGNMSVDNWILTGQVGYLWARDKVDGYTENGTGAQTVASSSFHLGQGRLRAEAAYSFGMFEPYASAMYQRDFSRTRVAFTPNDKNGFEYGLGVRYFGDDGISATAEWTTIRGRQSLTSDMWNLSVRVPF